MIPHGQDLNLPVTVVLVSDALAVIPAVLLRLEAATFVLRFSSDVPLGQRVVATAGGEKLRGQITAIDARTATVARARVHGTDARAAPRVVAEAELRVWTDGTWFAASIVDLSIAGVRFTSVCPAPALGARVKLALRMGRTDHPIVAVVRRSEATESGCSVGAEFAEVEDETSDVIADLTLRASEPSRAG